MPALSVHDFLWDNTKYSPQPVCVVFGDDPFLKSQAVKILRSKILSGEDAEFSFSRFEGASVRYDTVIKEVTTRAMFGGDRRLVLVEDADKFVTANRALLEDYAEKPAADGVLLLLLQSFAANTRLFKIVSQSGLIIEAKALPEKEVPKWIVRWAKYGHGVKCDPDAAEAIFQRIGGEHGLLDQELAKLSLSVPAKGSITLALVEESVGSWRTRSTFEMLDLALAGKTAEAIRQLDLLLAAGENGVGILAQIAYSLRKIGAATELILTSEKAGQKLPVASALQRIGVTQRWQLEKMEKQMIAMGRHRGRRLISWLLQADLDLKGASRIDPRYILETLIVKISAQKLKAR